MGRAYKKLVGPLLALLRNDPHGQDGNDDSKNDAEIAEGKFKVAHRRLEIVAQRAQPHRQEQARAAAVKYLALMNGLFMEVNPIPVKTALAMMGFCQELFRLPMCEMEEENREKLKGVLAAYGADLTSRPPP